LIKLINRYRKEGRKEGRKGHLPAEAIFLAQLLWFLFVLE
jgi:hypothetical protein